MPISVFDLHDRDAILLVAAVGAQVARVFYGATSGDTLTFLGKAGTASAREMFAWVDLRGDRASTRWSVEPARRSVLVAWPAHHLSVLASPV